MLPGEISIGRNQQGQTKIGRFGKKHPVSLDCLDYILSLRERPAWKALQQHHAKMQNLRGNVWAEVTIVMLPRWAGALADYSQSRK